MFWFLQSKDTLSNIDVLTSWATLPGQRLSFDTWLFAIHTKIVSIAIIPTTIGAIGPAKWERGWIVREEERESWEREKWRDGRQRNREKVGRRVWENRKTTMWGRARERREMWEGEMGVIEIDVCWFNHAELILRNGNIEEFWDIYRKRSPIFLIPITIHTPFGKKNSVTLPIIKLWRMLWTIL